MLHRIRAHRANNTGGAADVDLACERGSHAGRPPADSNPAGGANQIRVRAYNERLVLSLVRLHGALSKADIARRTGLSAQTVSVIMRALEKEGLLSRGEPVRGRVGQPSIPMPLNPDAVYSFGLKIGRRSADLVLMDFVGRIRMQLHRNPTPIRCRTKSSPSSPRASSDCEDRLDAEQRGRIAGLGIATPFELWNWAEEVGAPRGDMDVWRDVDLRADIAARVCLSGLLQNDATSACGAELVFGRTVLSGFRLFLHRLLHRRRHRPEFGDLFRPHRHGRRDRAAARARQERRDDAAA